LVDVDWLSRTTIADAWPPERTDSAVRPYHYAGRVLAGIDPQKRTHRGCDAALVSAVPHLQLEIHNTKGGIMRATSIGGSVRGMGGNRMVSRSGRRAKMPR